MKWLKGNKGRPLQQHCKRSWTSRWYSEWFTASGRRGRQDSWALYVLLPCCRHPSLLPLPPETCRGSTSDCCLLYGRRSVLGEPGRSRRGLFHGCPSRLSRHRGHRAEKETSPNLLARCCSYSNLQKSTLNAQLLDPYFRDRLKLFFQGIYGPQLLLINKN